MALMEDGKERRNRVKRTEEEGGRKIGRYAGMRAQGSMGRRSEGGRKDRISTERA